MHISSLSISNFRGIKDVKITDVGSIVIISGQNGSGKSCVFDAIRLLKSAYGGYQQNEWQQWMGEFQIQLGDRASDFRAILNDPTREFKIGVDFRLVDGEKDFIRNNLSELVRETIWRTIMPEAYGWGGLRLARFANQFRDREVEVNQREAEITPVITELLSQPTTRGECIIPINEGLHIFNNPLLQMIFSTFRPKQIGVIDFHGAQRHYGRESVQGINLNLQTHQHQQQSQSALYNYANKYNNVKSEMASAYVGEVLSEQAGLPRVSQSSLTNTLKELFKTFFPDKTFAGPQPTIEGSLQFPVHIRNQSGTHDLDDLSSGEKEILYGYLRIRSSAPRYSIILLDEPELHLNPRLIRGLPQFYREHLGVQLDNQIWLVTHSDTLIREVIGREGFDVFHMLPASAVEHGGEQLRRLSIEEDLPLLLTDLVGDLAAYQPVGKTIILEGGGDSDFDQRMVSTLFPEITGTTNLVSGTNKAKVQALHDLLDKIGEDNQNGMTFYSIIDRDMASIKDSPKKPLRQYMWDVYHIENYLLNAEYIRRVLRAMGKSFLPSTSQINDQLRECAEERVLDIVRSEITQKINKSIIDSLRVGIKRNDQDLSSLFEAALASSLSKANAIAAEKFSRDRLEAKEASIRQRLSSQIQDGTWIINFPGRSILKTFCGKYATEAKYELFRNLIVSRMSDDNFKPEGMKIIIYKIVNE